ncbi:unnamed protein product [Effrenium voratum]|nr:unnamed protein product [Effrenium voratum]
MGGQLFRRLENAGSEVNVFVYYWDTRDGPEFSGWWFGDKVGGTQVWSRAMDSGKAPPRKGWRVPWDGDEQQGLLLVEVMDTTAAMAQPVSASNGPRHASLLKQEPDPDQRVMAERVKLAMERIVAAEAEVEQAITSTKETLSGEESWMKVASWKLTLSSGRSWTTCSRSKNTWPRRARRGSSCRWHSNQPG